jgi:hypothetical protein
MVRLTTLWANLSAVSSLLATSLRRLSNPLQS